MRRRTNTIDYSLEMPLAQSVAFDLQLGRRAVRPH